MIETFLFGKTKIEPTLSACCLITEDTGERKAEPTDAGDKTPPVKE